jgi:hypothetical protein
VGHQAGGHADLDVPELVGDGLEGDRDARPEVLVGGLDVERLATDDQAHQIDRGGEQQFLGVAALGGPIEQVIKGCGREGVLDGGSRHHTERALLKKALEDPAEEHGRIPAMTVPSPCQKKCYRQQVSP